jgi:hypothetical protein
VVVVVVVVAGGGGGGVGVAVVVVVVVGGGGGDDTVVVVAGGGGGVAVVVVVVVVVVVAAGGSGGAVGELVDEPTQAVVEPLTETGAERDVPTRATTLNVELVPHGSLFTLNRGSRVDPTRTPFRFTSKPSDWAASRHCSETDEVEAPTTLNA